MMNTYEIKKLKGWLETIERANATIEDMYAIDYEDEDGQHELTREDLDDAFHLLCKIEEALNSEIKYYEEEEA